MTFKIGDRVRVKSDTEWHGIDIRAGEQATVVLVEPETVWVEFEGMEAAQADLPPDLLEVTTKLTPWGQFWASAYEQALRSRHRTAKVEKLRELQQETLAKLRRLGIDV